MKISQLILFIMIFAGWSCQKQMETDPILPVKPIEPDVPPVVEPHTLYATQWKLVGIMYTETNSLKVLEPNSKDSYIIGMDFLERDLSINQSINVFYYSSTNELYGHYNANYTTQEISFSIYEEMKVPETGDGDLWLNIFPTVESFFVEENELRLYYNKNKNYLLFTNTFGYNGLIDSRSNRIENFWDKPLPKIQECLHGKWKVLLITNTSTLGNFRPANNIVKIDTLNNTIETTTDENDPWSYLNGKESNRWSFSYHWEFKDVYQGKIPYCTTYLMQNEDPEIEGWYFDKITKIVDDTLLFVTVDYPPERYGFEAYRFLKIK